MARRSRNSETEGARNAALRAAAETGALTTAAGGMVLATLAAGEAREARQDAVPGSAAVRGDEGQGTVTVDQSAGAGQAAATPIEARSTMAVADVQAVPPSDLSGPAAVPTSLSEDVAAGSQDDHLERTNVSAAPERSLEATAAPDRSNSAQSPEINGENNETSAEPQSPSSLNAAPPTEEATASSPASDMVASLGTLGSASFPVPQAADLVESVFDTVAGTLSGASDLIEMSGLDLIDFTTGTLSSVKAGLDPLSSTLPNASALVSQVSSSALEEIDGTAASAGSAVGSMLDSSVPEGISSTGVSALAELPVEMLGGVMDDEAEFWGGTPDLPDGGILAEAADFTGAVVADLGFLGQSYQDEAAAHDAGGLAMTPGLSGLI